MTLKEATKIAKERLGRIDTIAKETIWLYSKSAQKSVAALIANDDTAIDADIFEDFLQKRERDVPFEYIVNEADFYGRKFFVDERCLIPRPETELLVEKAITIAKEINASSLLDICTGSGAIACTIKKELSSLTVCASDISEGALETAKINAARLNADVEFFLSDLFAGVTGNFDILTANPPYIQNGYKVPNNLLHEPQNALFGGEKGSEIVERAICGFLEMDFRAFICEIGFDQKKTLEPLLFNISGAKYEFYKDYAGFDRGFWIIKE